MATASVNSTVTTVGKSFVSRRTVTADGNVTKDPTLAAAKEGALTTRTSDSVGTLTMDAGHGLVTGRIDIFWSGGARYGVTGTVTVNSIAITGGGGDVLPADETDVTVMAPQLEDFVVEAGDLQGLFVGCSSPAWAVFLDDVAAVVKAIYVGGPTDAFQWDVEQITTIEAENPFALGDVVSVYLSHGGVVARQVNAVAAIN